MTEPSGLKVLDSNSTVDQETNVKKIRIDFMWKIYLQAETEATFFANILNRPDLLFDLWRGGGQ